MAIPTRYKMNDKEKQLILKLRKNSREKIKNIASGMGYPTSSMYDTLHKLEQKGIIEHRSRVMFEKIGYPIRMIILLKTSHDGRKKVQEYLLQSKNINTIYRISPGLDFYLEAIFKNHIDTQEFLEEIGAITEITNANIHNVLDIPAYERFLTQEEHFQN